MTADEVLKQMQIAAVMQTDNPVCVIDAQSRTITVPDQYKLLGVENDKQVERIYFRCPKIVGDNQDLSQDYQLFVNYQNANGDPDAYHIDDMEVDGDNITFSWILEENVTKYKGNIKFAFGAIKPGDEILDSDKNRWNTTINTDCTCLVGLKCTQQVAESNPDALVQIWAAIDELKADGGSGTPGKDGREIEIQNSGTALQWRYVGDEEWTDLVQLSEITGPKGDPGNDGITPHIGENGNWYIGEEDTGKPSRGEKGDPGSSDISVKTMQNTDIAVTFPEETPYDLYIFPEMAELSVIIADTDQEAHFFFDSGATATTFSLQAQDGGQIYTDAYSIEANMRYEVSVLHNVAIIKGVSTSAEA